MMILKLKSPTIHAIRILKYMGEARDVVPISSEICKDVNVTQSYFMRISKDLRRARLLETSQGRMGGFHLARNLEQITLYDVVMAMQGGEEFLDEVDMGSLGEIVGELNEYVAESMKQVCLTAL